MHITRKISIIEAMSRDLSQVIVRPANMEDLPVLLEFEQGIIRDERPFDPTIASDPILYYDLEKLIDNAEACVLVAEENNELLASGMARKWQARAYLDHKHHGFLGFMYTRPEHRGRGLNKLITDKLISWCKKEGLYEIRLTVYEGNTSAIRAYEKAGLRGHILEMRLPRDESEK
jgi:ribosomal protein S18 acetylase RimI-like enzyme